MIPKYQHHQFRISIKINNYHYIVCSMPASSISYAIDFYIFSSPHSVSPTTYLCFY